MSIANSHLNISMCHYKYQHVITKDPSGSNDESPGKAKEVLLSVLWLQRKASQGQGQLQCSSFIPLQRDMHLKTFVFGTVSKANQLLPCGRSESSGQRSKLLVLAAVVEITPLHARMYPLKPSRSGLGYLYLTT